MKGLISKKWKAAKFDKQFLIIVLLLVTFGFLIFLSASLGLQAREGFNLPRIINSQITFGLFGGMIAMYLAYKFPYKLLEEYAIPIFILAILLTLAVFIPGLGLSHGGATRWLSIGSFSMQPAELLKIGAVILAASWFSHLKQGVQTIKFGLLPAVGLMVVCGAVLVLQPDRGTIVVIIAAVTSVYLVAGAKWRHLLALFLCVVLALGVLALEPYARQRIMTFIQPAADSQGSGYQIQQSLIAVGSGKFFGRGPGQSIQKFNYLPEPVGDSVFAVYAEEYGFMGSIILIALYMAFAMRGYAIASKSRSRFGRYLVTGLVTIIITQSLLNIGAMINAFPLSGMPLIFVSQGGTALMLALIACGLILNVSANRKS